MDQPQILEVKSTKGEVIGHITCTESVWNDKHMLNIQWAGFGKPVSINYGVGKWKMIHLAEKVIAAFVEKFAHTLEPKG